eukprot:Rhum_TRINITY_DN14670_c11_g1::Rhum_TRINITY_DN14670_c11_g1_i1::g.108366::m.108366
MPTRVSNTSGRTAVCVTDPCAPSAMQTRMSTPDTFFSTTRYDTAAGAGGGGDSDGDRDRADRPATGAAATGFAAGAGGGDAAFASASGVSLPTQRPLVVPPARAARAAAAAAAVDMPAAEYERREMPPIDWLRFPEELLSPRFFRFAKELFVLRGAAGRGLSKVELPSPGLAAGVSGSESTEASVSTCGHSWTTRESPRCRASGTQAGSVVTSPRLRLTTAAAAPAASSSAATALASPPAPPPPSASSAWRTSRVFVLPSLMQMYFHTPTTLGISGDAASVAAGCCCSSPTISFSVPMCFFFFFPCVVGVILIIFF